MSSASASTATVSRTSRPRRAIATSGTVSPAAPKPAQCGASPPAGANANPPTATSPAPAGPSGGSQTARPASSRQAAAAAEKRSSRGARRRSSRRNRRGGAVAAVRRHARRAAERGQRGAVAVGLLEAEPVVVRAARGEHQRARVDVGADPHGQPRQHAAAGTPRAPDGALAAQQQLGARRAVEREAVIADLYGHADQGTARALPSRSRRGRATARSRPSAPSRPARTAAPCARTPRPCRACR